MYISTAIFVIQVCIANISETINTMLLLIAMHFSAAFMHVITYTRIRIRNYIYLGSLLTHAYMHIDLSVEKCVGIYIAK